MTAPLASEQGSALGGWFDALDTPTPDESFGQYVARAGRVKWGARYHHPAEQPGPEMLRIDVRRFDCVSFLENVLAVARCGWSATPGESCFLGEVAATRYRGGAVEGFASRLHYLEDWIADNARRGRLEKRTAQLGGTGVRTAFNYVSSHPELFPGLREPGTYRAMGEIELTLSLSSHDVLGRDLVERALSDLEDGDLVAIVGSKPGELVTHAGFVSKSERGTPRLLHASSHHGRVVLTRASVARYVLRRSDRRGIMVARPLPPSRDPTRRRVADEP